jgi:hypothetical protein
MFIIPALWGANTQQAALAEDKVDACDPHDHADESSGNTAGAPAPNNIPPLHAWGEAAQNVPYQLTTLLLAAGNTIITAEIKPPHSTAQFGPQAVHTCVLLVPCENCFWLLFHLWWLSVCNRLQNHSCPALPILTASHAGNAATGTR